MSRPLRRPLFVAARSKTTPDCFLSVAGHDRPTLVAIHGISRNAAEVATRFASHPAFARTNIVAPLFERKRFGKYQQLLARRSGEASADQALFALLSDLAKDRCIPVDKVMLFGFSGGAQMAHRLAMLQPDRVTRLCAVSAGWYLWPDRSLHYPFGLGEGCPTEASDDAFLDIPMTVIVGERDTRIDASVRQDSPIVTLQGPDRVSRASAWTRAIRERAVAKGKTPLASLVTLRNGTHDFGQCARDAGLIDHAAQALMA